MGDALSNRERGKEGKGGPRKRDDNEDVIIRVCLGDALSNRERRRVGSRERKREDREKEEREGREQRKGDTYVVVVGS